MQPNNLRPKDICNCEQALTYRRALLRIRELLKELKSEEAFTLEWEILIEDCISKALNHPAHDEDY